jgi:DNA-binding MarR family transcriptional regulator
MPVDDLYEKPGYLIRRLRQIAAAIFAEEAGPFDVTSQQYTTLRALAHAPRLEQIELCDLLSLDRATMATLLARLEEKGLVQRVAPAGDRRRRRVSLTAAGRPRGVRADSQNARRRARRRRRQRGRVLTLGDRRAELVER